MTTLSPPPPSLRDAPAAPAGMSPLPLRRRDLIVRPLGEDGGHVVKDPRSGAYYNLGPQESFLLARLDGHATTADVCAAFTTAFGEALDADGLSEFLGLARDCGFLADASLEIAPDAVNAAAPPPQRPLPPPSVPRGAGHQSILYWRTRIFDPDRLFDRLEPKLRFVWTRGFFLASAVFIVAAMVLVWLNAGELVTRFPHMMRWETLVLAWLTLITATTLHEFSHGLTCKHFGGEVHEVGFLAMYFIPCLYCNVSDAWLFREKSRRIWVTLAGGYFDLCAWAAAVFVWRLAAQDTVANYLAWVVLSVLGLRNLFNFNPLIKLDGYYLLSDATALPNLRQRAWDCFLSRARWLLWGAPRPAPVARGRFLLGFGMAAWVYSLMLVALIAVGFVWFLRDRLGDVGAAAGLAFGVWLSRSSFEGLSNGEVRAMITTRVKRTAVWSIVLVVMLAGLALGRLEEKAHGSFTVRSATRADVRAPLTGLLASVAFDEGDRVAKGQVVATLHIQDLQTRLAQRRAEIVESEARVRMLRAGGRGAGERDGAANDDAVRRVAEIDAETAHTAQVEAELRHLEAQQELLAVQAPVGGLVVTPRLRDRIGQLVAQGDLICALAEPAELEIEIVLDEQEATHLRTGQPVDLKARALPYETFHATVQRIAPAAVAGDVQSKLSVYCTMANGSPALRPGMSGHARIHCGTRPAGLVLFGRVLRTLRTEFWW